MRRRYDVHLYSYGHAKRKITVSENAKQRGRLDEYAGERTFFFIYVFTFVAVPERRKKSPPGIQVEHFRLWPERRGSWSLHASLSGFPSSRYITFVTSVSDTRFIFVFTRSDVLSRMIFEQYRGACEVRTSENYRQRSAEPFSEYLPSLSNSKWRSGSDRGGTFLVTRAARHGYDLHLVFDSVRWNVVQTVNDVICRFRTYFGTLTEYLGPARATFTKTDDKRDDGNASS